ncbi:biotin-[acetyl-CoA-carboxylase] ligase [Pneumocystis jirovecii RU7]|uniref:Biotin-[acetyl-CoA-carboxylase] ligase n=1 Tax=Pneumocystis jirovecii (strain RU7) TaxID=1408657 RepID=A0A0W4ZTY9_PNEJ7|nr:biotin-[acetyl-CoA-carboxylase] ligase [Pneumocystis jirovecii RU7]KTW31841.1 biotin-[acetyl-CoA-carboxylase] ligase [Pneumocystis jirovecii RU7]
MNILIYSGTFYRKSIFNKNKSINHNHLDKQISELSVKYTFSILRFLLSPYYFILKVDEKMLEKDEWEEHTALLVIPDSKDISCKIKLNETLNQKILKYIQNGGKYIGIGEGARYVSALSEYKFNGNTEHVKSDGPIFFPGIARDAILSDITSNKNNHMILIQTENISSKNLYFLYFYHHTATLFIDADQFSNIQILGTYKNELSTDSKSQLKAAIIHCKIEKGQAVLFGIHPEYSTLDENLRDKNGDYSNIDNLLLIESQKIEFLKHMFQLLNLQTTSKPIISTNISDLHLFSEFPNIVEKIADVLYNISEKIAKNPAIKCENDTFYLQETSSISMHTLVENYLNNFHENDYNKIPKYIKIHRNLPNILEMPFFNHKVYFENLLESRTLQEDSYQLGNIVLYGETLTSSQTLLDKNLKLLKVLPTGFIFVATQQIAGKGRKNNIWISPLGTLMFSLVIRHSEYLKSSIIFMQYLVSLAIVEAIKNYDVYYNELDIHIKWPNDICIKQLKNIDKPTFTLNNIGYIKIGGILINCNYIDNAFLMIIGCGINVTNNFPTSLKIIIENLNAKRMCKQLPLLSEIKQEKLLARIITTLENMYYKFSSNILGFELFEQQYYKYWLHSNQIITLEDTENKVIITGIDTTHGGLVAKTIENEKKKEKIYQFLPDLSSFDVTQGLIKKK